MLSEKSDLNSEEWKDINAPFADLSTIPQREIKLQVLNPGSHSLIFRLIIFALYVVPEKMNFSFMIDNRWYYSKKAIYCFQGYCQAHLQADPRTSGPI